MSDRLPLSGGRASPCCTAYLIPDCMRNYYTCLRCGRRFTGLWLVAGGPPPWVP